MEQVLPHLLALDAPRKPEHPDSLLIAPLPVRAFASRPFVLILSRSRVRRTRSLFFLFFRTITMPSVDLAEGATPRLFFFFFLLLLFLLLDPFGLLDHRDALLEGGRGHSFQFDIVQLAVDVPALFHEVHGVLIVLEPNSEG